MSGATAATAANMFRLFSEIEKAIAEERHADALKFSNEGEFLEKSIFF